ncbi:hypothetical protein [Gimesia chilikensis]|uniref:hypothetical protein n=1 Tax=Gimesia chilikensis TaxID=2605989 RepID=UPI00118B43CF|nr:hypothetical protein [Gimesia chilikensis]QDT87157.1 hypothetical protein MalM14_48420 [Gimesia chilikensis]
MITLQAGQTFEINDSLLADFPWHEFTNVTRFVMEWSAGSFPDIELILKSDLATNLVACLSLEQVAECRLPAMGIRRLQFSSLTAENVRSQQWEQVNYRIFDTDFEEPVLMFKTGQIQILAAL